MFRLIQEQPGFTTQTNFQTLRLFSKIKLSRPIPISFFTHESSLHMAKMTVKIQIRGIILTLDLLLQTVTTKNTNLVILETAWDLSLFIGTLQIVDLTFHTKETNHQP